MFAEDKRLTKRLIDYWDRLRRESAIPSWEKFNVGSLGDIWGQCCVWRVEIATVTEHSHQYTYEYMGSSAKEALGKDFTGLKFKAQLQQFQGARITARIDEVVQTLKPLSDEGNFVNQANKMIKYRSCLLPFGTVDGKVTHIVLGLSWRTF